MNPENTSDAIRATQARESVAAANRNSLVRLMAAHDLTLPYASLEQWRPTKQHVGNIPGFERQFTILCTDGCVAWFQDVFGVLFHGHIQHFTGKVEPLHSIPSTPGTPKAGGERDKAKTPRAKKEKITVSHALEVLRAALNRKD